MSFWIRYYKNGLVTDEIWSGTLTAAQDAYCQSVRDGDLDRLEIRDANDEVIFRYPVGWDAIHPVMEPASVPAVAGAL